MTSVRSTTDVIPGFYSVRLVKGGPRVPARVLIGCHCTILGGDDNALHEWTMQCDRGPVTVGILSGVEVEPEKVWRAGALQEISQADYELLLAQARWDAAHDPDAPLANPRQPVDFSKVRVPF